MDRNQFVAAIAWVFVLGCGAPESSERSTGRHSQCEQGDATACVEIADRGIERDPVEARKWLVKGCRNGDGACCRRVGVMTAHGVGGLADLEIARELFDMACAYGDGLGCHNAGAMRNAGLGGGAEPSRARELFNEGCDKGLARSCYGAAVLLEFGRGGARDAVRAETLYQMACRKGLDPACDALALLAHAVDPIAEELEDACASGDGRVCDVLARNADSNGCSQRARVFYEKACALDVGSACTDGGLIAANTDKAAAFALFEKGCEARDSFGCYNLGLAHEWGFGVNGNRRAARSAFDRGCFLDHTLSCRLRDVLSRWERAVTDG